MGVGESCEQWQVARCKGLELVFRPRRQVVAFTILHAEESLLSMDVSQRRFEATAIQRLELSQLFGRVGDATSMRDQKVRSQRCHLLSLVVVGHTVVEHDPWACALAIELRRKGQIVESQSAALHHSPHGWTLLAPRRHIFTRNTHSRLQTITGNSSEQSLAPGRVALHPPASFLAVEHHRGFLAVGNDLEDVADPAVLEGVARQQFGQEHVPTLLAPGVSAPRLQPVLETVLPAFLDQVPVVARVLVREVLHDSLQAAIGLDLHVETLTLLHELRLEAGDSEVIQHDDAIMLQ